MSHHQVKTFPRKKRHQRVRAKISGSASRPRLCVFRSAKHIWAQLIDDAKGHTLASASDIIKSKVKSQKSKVTKTEWAKEVGKALAGRALTLGIATVVFDRGGYAYQGRVRALADGARQGGLQF